MPAVVSEGYGSYVSTTKREGREILMAEAARALNNWLERYGGFVGLHVSTLPVEKLARALQSKVETEAALWSQQRTKEREGTETGTMNRSTVGSRPFSLNFKKALKEERRPPGGLARQSLRGGQVLL